jgi:soluble lytic murein transglycosylase-like protein
MSDIDGTALEVTTGAAESDRRHGRDRRGGTNSGRRGRVNRPWVKALKIAARDAAMVVATLTAIVVSINFTRPIYANQPKVVAAITEAVPGAKAVLGDAPAAVEVDPSNPDQIVQSPQFEEDRKRFAADLVATGQVKPARADSIAFYAVREAYRNGIPPAVIFGVMLTENARFISHALSNVGAVGLMQIYPKYWLKPLGEKLGKDLASDSTNIKYGAHILSEYIKRGQGGSVSRAQLSKGLLKYNGCVRGSNTPHCHNYPDKVKRYVDKQGTNICGTKGFYECIAKPFVAGFTGVLGVSVD